MAIRRLMTALTITIPSFSLKVNGILPIITVKLPMRITNRISALVNICAVYA